GPCLATWTPGSKKTPIHRVITAPRGALWSLCATPAAPRRPRACSEGLRPCAGRGGGYMCQSVMSDPPIDAPEPEPTEANLEVDPLVEAEAKLAALKDQLLRTAADFENFRKRARREADDARFAGREAM